MAPSSKYRVTKKKTVTSFMTRDRNVFGAEII